MSRRSKGKRSRKPSIAADSNSIVKQDKTVSVQNHSDISQPDYGKFLPRDEPIGLINSRQKQKFFAGVAIVLIFGLVGCWWLCSRSAKISFLTRDGPAEWVIFPQPPHGIVHPVEESSTVFQQSFSMDKLPLQANLKLRALKHFQVIINGVSVESPNPKNYNWKDFTEINVAGMLRPGTNQIAVIVQNSDGPPALWLLLEADTFRLNSNRNWEASQGETGWQKVRLASDPPSIEKGNPLYAGENAEHCFLKQMPLLLFFAVLSTGLVLAGSWLYKRYCTQNGSGTKVNSTKFVMLLLVGIAVGWIALYSNNFGRLPKTAGFDVTDHLAYINYIKTNHSLPLANQGLEMYNPPLYYFISAILATLFNLDVFSVAATQLFRGFGLLVGVTHIILIFLCLRLVFPERPGIQLFGLVLAAFLPEHLYISQYVTNESLAAAWITGTIYFCLRLLKGEQHLWQLSAAGGACLGAALLTKFTAILTIPFFYGALFGWLALRRIRAVRIWLEAVS